ncbi:MAG: OmpH family outer membrane protein [Paludibacter sp.]|nr:OmpH family outer membrane protein [Paludibacter sp.]MDD4199181.1 OmpH family outer membrane protein [Paludibacter sp.]MDD4428637.1 OmpH family outer membrane protein [Paludibacter sp.]
MKNILLVLNSILVVAVIVLFVLVLGNKNHNSVNGKLSGKDSTVSVHLPIAYVNIDSLLLNYQFAKESNESLMKKQEDSRLDLNMKARQLQNEMAEFQRKLENNAFLSRERAEQEQNRLMRKEQDLQQLNAKLSQELMDVQQKVSEELRDSINSFLKEYNKDKKYELILSNTSSDNILLSNDIYDITKEVTEALNKRYSKKK